MKNEVTNIVVAGLGGQGVLTCANIISYAAFLAGFDVKSSEVHGMSQRGGSVSSDVRYGSKVWSPMIADGEADFLLLLSDDEEERVKHYLLPNSGTLLRASLFANVELPKPATLNTALLGLLSKNTVIEQCYWEQAIKERVPQAYIDDNLSAFQIGLNYEH